MSLLAAAAAAAPNNAFIDRFERLDNARWTVSDGWSNGSAWLNDWRRTQVAAGPSGLTVTLDVNPASKGGYSSGEIRSHDDYRYGYFEARMKAARGSGVDTGFFTYTGPSRGQPWNEVDVEILGKDPRWYVDGKLVHEETGAQLPLPNESQQVFFDMWNSNSIPDWMGRFTWPGHAITAQLQCVATSPHFTGLPLC
jgi:beta-glucanase (GH16 family)